MQSERSYKKSNYQVGKKYNRLTLTGKNNLRSMYGQQRRWVEAECECGVIKWYLLTRLVCNETKSCGCLRDDLSRERMTTHGLSNHLLYDVWHKILERCFKPNVEGYENYGGRGITVCEEWQENFVTFYEWAMANGWEEGMSVDRINNDLHYDPYNCRIAGWAKERGVQNRNTRRNVPITAWGETKVLFDWGEDPRCKIGVWGLRSRYDRGGWDSMEEMISAPATEKKESQRNMKTNRMLTAFGETKCLNAWLEDERCVIGIDGLRDRLKRGWDFEKALTTTHNDSRKRLMITAFGETKPILEWVKDSRCKIKIDCLRDRLKLGLDPELAMSYI